MAKTAYLHVLPIIHEKIGIRNSHRLCFITWGEDVITRSLERKSLFLIVSYSEDKNKPKGRRK